jgi:hypothetical protein
MPHFVLQNFADLHRTFAAMSADDAYAEFVRRYGVRWAQDLTRYVTIEQLKENRSGFFEFYFDESYPLSVRSDPRSGMFVRDPSSEGGKIECLLYLALGLEGFAQLAKAKRVIDGKTQSVTLNGSLIESDSGAFKDDHERMTRQLTEGQPVEWNDAFLRPNYEDALIQARDALLAASGTSYSKIGLHTLLHVVLCGAHCPRRKGSNEIAEEMAKISTLAGAIRAAAKNLLV